MIYTSYFAQIKNLPDNLIPVSICAKVPVWYDGFEYYKLAPTYDILMDYKVRRNQVKYVKEFNDKVLSSLNVDSIINDLSEFIGNDKTKRLCLLCYERPEDFCHRHLVAKWFRANGYNCKEWTK